MHSNGPWQIAGLPAISVLEVEGVQGLEVIWVSLQVHLAQELILQDSVIPYLGGDRESWGPLQDQEWGCSCWWQGLEFLSYSASLAEQKEPCIASASP